MEKKTSQTSRVKVSPIATKFWENGDDVQEEEQVNLFEVLEDRYAYQGCNKLVYLLVYMFVVYQCLKSLTHFSEMASHKHIIKKKLIFPKPDFQREGFNAWGLKKVKDVINDPYYFGDKLKLMRATIYVVPFLCNNTQDFPRGINNAAEFKNGIHQHSRAKSYEEVCPLYTATDSNKGSLISHLKQAYNIYSINHEAWDGVAIPIHTVELNTKNRTDIATMQLRQLEEALSQEKTALRLYLLIIETLNPFDHIWYCK